MTLDTPTAPAPVPAVRPGHVKPRRGLGLFSRAALALVLVVAFALPFLINDYTLTQLALMLSLALAVLGLNLLTGYTGLISVGHGALMGIGGYTTVALALHAGVPYPVGLLCGTVICAVAGLVIGLPSLRLSGLYLALVTLGFAIIFPSLVKRWESVTGGVSGLLYLTPEPPSWISLTSSQWIYLLTLVGFLAGAVGVHLLVNGRIGRALDAVRRSELMAASNGIAVGRLKLAIFSVSSAIAGLAGGLYQLVVGSALPDTYVITFSITLLTAAVVGGVRSISGALIGAAFIVYAPDYASQVGDRGPQLVYAIALMLVIYLARGGISSFLSSLFTRFAARASRPTRPE